MKRPTLWGVLVIGLGLAGLAGLSAPASAKPLKTCGQEGKLTVLCGPDGVEDMIAVPGTNWIVASGMGENGKGGALHLIDAKARTWMKVYPSPKARQDFDKMDYYRCPGPPDPTKFVSHGIALKQTGPKRYRILSVNHGGRESVEVFRLDVSQAMPVVSWIGCVVMPPTIYMNSVAFLPDGGFALTKFYDPKNPKGFNAIFAGEITGGVYEWRTEQGLDEVPGTGLTGANGIAVSKDGKWLFVNAWGGREVARYRLGSDKPEKTVIKVAFSPDNLRWAPDGSLFVAGQNGKPDTKTGVPDFKGWTVLKLDPKTMKTTEVASGAPDSMLQNVSNAIEVDGALWLGAFRGDKIGYLPLN